MPPERTAPDVRLKSLYCLVVAIVAAAAVLWAVPAGFERVLANPAVAALSPVVLESLFMLVLFGLLGGAALVGGRVTRQRLSAGRAPVLSLGLGTALGMAGLSAALALSVIAGATRLGFPPPADGGLMVLAIVLTLFQTSAEELYFRGWLQSALRAGWGRWAAVLVSALAFALLHFIDAASAPMALVNLTLAGVWLALLAERSSGLMLPIGAHFGWNWAEQSLFGASPNPGVGNFGALIDVDLVGSPWWGGSGEGLNPSLSVMFALVAMILAILAWPRADVHPDAVEPARPA